MQAAAAVVIMQALAQAVMAAVEQAQTIMQVLVPLLEPLIPAAAVVAEQAMAEVMPPLRNVQAKLVVLAL